MLIFFLVHGPPLPCDVCVIVCDIATGVCDTLVCNVAVRVDTLVCDVLCDTLAVANNSIIKFTYVSSSIYNINIFY